MRCIYSGKDKTSETFSSAEHIFPKCIGGIQTLPKGWVCDSVNNSFSSLELRFARQNPSVAIPRMFLPTTGRRKHKNRNLIGVFRNTLDSNDYSLGYISNGTPTSINQIRINAQFPVADNELVTISIVIPPHESKTQDAQIREFWTKLGSYNGNACIVKDKSLPADIILIGYQDSKWYLGISANLNGETVKKDLHEFITKMIVRNPVEELLAKGQKGRSVHQIHSQFEIEVRIYDILRVYAKIAVNCLAHLKGHEFIMNKAFDGIKSAILTGIQIEDYVWIYNGPSTVKTVFKQFEERFTLGAHHHSTTIFYKDGHLYAEIALYGADNRYFVKLGKAGDYSFTDLYICDWENGTEYTLADCVLKICRHDEEEEEFMKYDSCERETLCPD